MYFFYFYDSSGSDDDEDDPEQKKFNAQIQGVFFAISYAQAWYNLSIHESY